MVTKKCLVCKKVFPKPSTCCKKEWKKRKYCSRKCKNVHMKTICKGSGNSCYRGGRTIQPLGYIEILKSNHPCANNRGYVYEHRLVMEQMIGRFLKKGEIVHHINKIRDDNRPENLKLFTSIGDHLKFELTGRRRPNHSVAMKNYWSKRNAHQETPS